MSESETIVDSAIKRVVEHNKGPVALSRLLEGVPVYQEIQRWVARGYASPGHYMRLKPFLPQGVTVEDLFEDYEQHRARREPKGSADSTERAA